ncbi:hypothetical protein QBC47DRAFT_327854 [Echria macrotheca]|uniref:Clr5 domain-containing protein n=1 Tax=Echria macrotheca TaxID=438768 RepID=A0AAJ0B6R5_9PEZI|nr:hypothetical protein QBC47DRAFT_327854 [Echria macrotheca]
MGYKWEQHRQECYELYVEQGKSLDEVVNYMREAHNFTPSRRAFQVQFSFWKFPAKYPRRWKDERLVEAVRILWERNLQQKEMLIELQKQGWDLTLNQLSSVRTHLGLKLRATAGGYDVLEGGADEVDAAAGGDDDDDGGGHEADQQQTDHHGAGSRGDESAESSALEARLRKEMRKRQLEMESEEPYAAKKRRRRTKEYAGMPADPPGPPRFPSETTLTEAREILSLDDDQYRLLREKFQAICEKERVMRKTEAGPEKWEAMKNQLVRESMHLRGVMWEQEGMERKNLAVDVIACDVTKRMRVAGMSMTMPVVRRVLNLNPALARWTAAALYKILVDDQYTRKQEEGSEHWEELKSRWLARSNHLQRVIAPTGVAEHDQRIQKAIDLLARDVVRRYQGDKKRNKVPKEPKPKKPEYKALYKALVPGASGPDASVDDETADFSFDSQPELQSTDGQHVSTTTQSANRRSQRVQAQQPAETPSRSDGYASARLLPPPESTTSQSVLPIDDAHSHLDVNLLLSDPSMYQQQQPPQQKPRQTRSYARSRPQAGSSSQAVPSHPAAAAADAAPRIGVYFRLHPSSTVVPPPGTSYIWITTISSRTIADVRAAATERFSVAGEDHHVVCTSIEGIIKDGKGGEMIPLPVGDDVELGAYLDHVQAARAAPTFNVQLHAGGGGGSMTGEGGGFSYSS